MRKAIATLLYMAAGVALVLTAGPFFFTPDSFTFNVPLPESAEVLPASRVHPGTFKLELPWDQIRDRAKTAPSKAIVSYGRGAFGAARVEAYVPRGDSTFYYSKVNPASPWSFGFYVGRVERAGDQFTAYPMVAWSLLLLSGIVSVLCGMFGWVAVPLRFRKKT